MREACARHGVTVDPSRFDAAVAAASSTLHAAGGPYDPEVFIDYTKRIIEGMGGSGPGVDAAARDLYDEWSACHHFTLYEEVPEVLRALHADGFTIGLISNTQRSLKTFEEHFELDGLFKVAISSSDHGFMKPHPSHLRGRPAPGGRDRRRRRDGRRQRAARYRGGAAPGDARHSRGPIRAVDWRARRTCRSSNRCAS